MYAGAAVYLAHHRHNAKSVVAVVAIQWRHWSCVYSNSDRAVLHAIVYVQCQSIKQVGCDRRAALRCQSSSTCNVTAVDVHLRPFPVAPPQLNDQLLVRCQQTHTI
jgi:hypothetical protein